MRCLTRFFACLRGGERHQPNPAPVPAAPRPRTNTTPTIFKYHFEHLEQYSILTLIFPNTNTIVSTAKIYSALNDPQLAKLITRDHPEIDLENFKLNFKTIVQMPAVLTGATHQITGTSCIRFFLACLVKDGHVTQSQADELLAQLPGYKKPEPESAPRPRI
jgi:hypothetical protein